MALSIAPPPTGEPVSGRTVLNEVCDLIADRLPRIPYDDPARPALAALAPRLAAELGRPPVELAGGGR
jgi:hypothetical protein